MKGGINEILDRWGRRLRTKSFNEIIGWKTRLEEIRGKEDTGSINESGELKQKKKKKETGPRRIILEAKGKDALAARWGL